jgi:pantoate--beta-alanine ligase
VDVTAQSGLLLSPALTRTRTELAAELELRSGPTGVVMTMGALHEGHVALIRTARARCQTVVVTIFVNPLQFGAGEDLDRYPRTFEADLARCRDEGVDIVFAPAQDTVYPNGSPQVTVHPGQLGDELEGASRPGHFAGVLTVVCKLLHTVSPVDAAFFGEKDYQQLMLVTRMARDLDIDTEIVPVPTVRESDGLALSSRNRFLSTEDRRAALALSRALRAGLKAGRDGAAAVLAAGRAVLDAEPGVQADYLHLAGTDLGPPPAAGPARLLVAAKVGSTRLIDNIAVTLG